MRNLLMRLAASLVLALSTGILGAAQMDVKPATLQMKAHQREEREALRMRQRYMKQSLRGQPIPRAERVRLKHEMKKEKRDLHQRQKDERQAMKDRDRSMKAFQKQP